MKGEKIVKDKFKKNDKKYFKKNNGKKKEVIIKENQLKEYKNLSTIEKLKYKITKNIFSIKRNVSGLQISFLGAAKTVTGSKYLLENAKSKIFVDCGLFQGLSELRRRNWNELPIIARNIDAIILTHAHLDHSGYLPLLVKNGFSGKIYCTQATFNLAKLILPDSGFLQEEDARNAKKHNYSKHKIPKPLYTQKDAIKTFKQFHTVDFNKEIKINEDFSFQIIRAGHILGAGSVIVKSKEKSILFSGDLGRYDSPIASAPAKIPFTTDYVVCESTYGDKYHTDLDPEQFLGNIINKAIEKGGKILIPAFAVGRTQKILYYINNLKNDRKIPDIQIFLDSPMSIKVTNLVDDYVAEKKLTKEQYQDIYRSVKFCVTREQSKKIFNYTNSAIIISASGMAAGGRILHHIANYAPDPSTTIILVGYQAEGTRGRDLQEGKKEIKMHGKMVPIKADVEILSNMSDHGDVGELLRWLSFMPSKPKKLFITHGELGSSEAFLKKVKEELKWETEVPNYLETKKL
jgi:metallo-beta-lactamase family protein